MKTHRLSNGNILIKDRSPEAEYYLIFSRYTNGTIRATHEWWCEIPANWVAV